MNDTDLISVILPTYNRANLIKRSAESVLNQTYKNLELIIIDDGSTDNTKEIIDSINDNRIVYVKQQNQGACVARNKGIDIAKGEYIAFQDSDDVWYLDKLEKQINALKKNNADVVFCKMFILGNLRKKIFPKRFKKGFLEKDVLPIEIGTQTLLLKREILLNYKFDIQLPRFQDFELLLRLQKKYPIYCIDEGLVNYYVQDNSISTNPEKVLKAWEIILEKHKKFLINYSSSLEYLALSNINDVFKIKDSYKREKLLDIVFSFSKSIKVKTKYLFYKFHFDKIYKIRELLYKSVSISIKNVLNILKNIINYEKQ